MVETVSTGDEPDVMILFEHRAPHRLSLESRIPLSASSQTCHPKAKLPWLLARPGCVALIDQNDLGTLQPTKVEVETPP